MPLLLYLHGYNSSPLSFKAVATRDWFARHAPEVEVLIPGVPPFADQAMRQIAALIEARLPEQVWLMGSSMGGFFAAALAERYGLKAVLINPAVNPSRGLHNWVGENANYHTGATWHFAESDIQPFRDLENGPPAEAENYRVLLQSGDEVLDYRDALQHYSQCHLVVEQGGDHSFVDFERHLPAIYQFLTNSLNN